MHFHLPSEKAEQEKEAEEDDEKKNAGLWKSFQNRILGGSDDTENEKDPHFRGTAPTLTGFLTNVAAKTSTGHKEKLEFSVP